MSSVESQMDLMRSHVTRGVPVATKSDGGRTLQLAVPAGWTKDALCLDNWEHYDASTNLKPGQAARLCFGCPVLAQCLEAAMTEERGLSAGSRYGIRGGLSPKERAELEFSGRECAQGHRGRWSSHPNTTKPVCLECKAEESRERYTPTVAEARSIQRVTCLGCKAEMRTSNFARHLGRKHGEQVAA